ncbi:MAG: NUDIX domain-containing protein [Candidatus Nanoarchaeia archaeon]
MEREQRRQKLKKKARYGLSCGVVIFNINKKKPEYLLVKYPTYWGFIRGKVEPGETEELTAFREALEEAGLNDLMFVPGFRETINYFFKRGDEIIRKDDVYLLAKTSTWKVKISHEHENIRWCSYEEALAMLKHTATKEILAKAHNIIKTHMKIW